MDRALTEGNRVVNKRQLEINRSIYKQKIHNPMKGINNSPPFAFEHPLNKSSVHF